MSTIQLRDLVARPQTAKNLTSQGQLVKVFDEEKPLWVLMAAEVVDEDATANPSTKAWMDEELDRMLSEPIIGVEASELIQEARR